MGFYIDPLASWCKIQAAPELSLGTSEACVCLSSSPQVASKLRSTFNRLATPARVALGMLTIVVSAANYLGLVSRLPTTSQAPWIARVVQTALYFNTAAMIEVVLVSFGMLCTKWLRQQHEILDRQLPWKRALAMQATPPIYPWT